MLKIAWNDLFTQPLPEGHRFPMVKYDLLPEQLLHEGTITESNIFSPDPVEDTEILLTHDRGYLAKLNFGMLTRAEERRMGFPYSRRLVDREKVITQGTVQAVHFAMQYGIACNVAGGTHHAFSDRGEGFCLLNDVAVAANSVLHSSQIRRILVVDLDVHQGNGTANLFEEEPRVYTFSMHGAKNYPLQKEHSDLDIPLPDGTGDSRYLRLLREHLPRLMDKVEPELVFYISGVDVLATDRLGRLSLTRNGCRDRDRFVLETCRMHAVPVVVTMGGGYSDRLVDIVEAHANTFRLAGALFF